MIVRMYVLTCIGKKAKTVAHLCARVDTPSIHPHTYIHTYSLMQIANHFNSVQ